MYMKKIALLFALASIISVNTTAQTEEELAAQAQELLQKMSDVNKKYTSIEASFTLTIDNKQQNKKSNHKGTLTIKGNKYVYELMGTTTYFDGQYTYAYVKDANEVTIEEPDESSDFVVSPMSLFSAYEEGYKMRYIETTKVDGSECGVVDLYPKDLNCNYSRIRLTIDKSSNAIKLLMKQGKDGVTLNVKVDTFKTNRNIPDTNFVFDTKANPKVEVVDMR